MMGVSHKSFLFSGNKTPGFFQFMKTYFGRSAIEIQQHDSILKYIGRSQDYHPDVRCFASIEEARD